MKPSRGARTNLHRLARQVHVGAVETGLRGGDPAFHFGDADLRLFVVAPCRQPGFEQFARPAFIQPCGGQRAACGLQLQIDLLALCLQALDQLRVDIGNPHDRIALLDRAAIAHVPFLDPARHQCVDILLAFIGVERVDGAAPGGGLHPGGIDQEHQRPRGRRSAAW